MRDTIRRRFAIFGDTPTSDVLHVDIRRWWLDTTRLYFASLRLDGEIPAPDMFASSK